MIAEDMIQIQRTPASRVSELDFDNLKFGREFSDHMFVMDYAEGRWLTPQIIPYQHLTMSPATSALHYGQAIFEGMKAFKNLRNEVYMFRPEMNIERLNYSARRMCMPEVDTTTMLQALHTLVDMDRDWIPTDPHSSLYMRPFMYATDAYIGVKPSETYRLCVFTCPVKAYYKGAVKVKVEEHFTRSVKGGTGSAKAAGNYAGALYPAKLAQEEGFDQLLWTDAEEHRWIEESGTMNVVFRSGKDVFSPEPSDTILDGITRDSIMSLAKDYGYNAVHRKISVEEIQDLLSNGMLDEAFGAGTAATVAPIQSIHIGNTNYKLSDPKTWNLANRLSTELDAIKRGDMEDLHGWNYPVTRLNS